MKSNKLVTNRSKTRLKNTVGNNDVSSLSNDGTVTGAIKEIGEDYIAKGSTEESNMNTADKVAAIYSATYGEVKQQLDTMSEQITTLNDSLSSLNADLTNEDNEKFVFGVKDGVRGFYTDPSRADDCFVPFIKSFLPVENYEFITVPTSTSNYTYTLKSKLKLLILTSRQAGQDGTQTNLYLPSDQKTIMVDFISKTVTTRNEGDSYAGNVIFYDESTNTIVIKGNPNMYNYVCCIY